MSTSLSQGFCAQVNSGNSLQSTSLKGIRLQVLDLENVGRVRFTLSDGQYMITGVWPTPDPSIVQRLSANAIIEILDGAVVEFRGAPVLTINSLQYLDTPSSRIGNPTTLPPRGQGGSGANVNAPPSRPAYGQSFNSPQQPYGSGGMIGGAGQDQYYPIKKITMFLRMFTIKVRVTAKSDIKSWSNPKGEGRLFSVDLIDQAGDQIRATAFTNVVDRFYPLLEEGKVYTISNAKVRPAKKGMTRFQCEYDLQLEESTDIQPVGEDRSIKQNVFKFLKLDEIRQLQVAPYNPNPQPGQLQAPETLVDVIGVVKAVKPISKITSKKTNREMAKRDITIVDDTNYSIDLTLWGEAAERFNEKELDGYPIIAVKACRVSDYNGRTLSTSFNSQVIKDPDVPEGYKLQEWFKEVGNRTSFTAMSSGGMGGGGVGGRGFGSGSDRKCFADIEADISSGVLNSSNPSQAQYYNIKAFVAMLKVDRTKQPWYNACPSPDCKKKVTQDGDMWVCDHCSKRFPHPEPSYVFSFLAADYSGSRWISILGKQGEAIFGMPATKLSEYLSMDPAQFDAIVAQSTNKIVDLRVRAKYEINQTDNSLTVRCQALNAQEVDIVEESKSMLAELSKLSV